MVAIKSFAKDGLEIASNFSKSNPIAMESMLTSALSGAGVAGVGSLLTDAGLFSSALLGGAVGGVLGGAGGKHIEDLRGNFSAIMWQGMARTFGESLKSSYDMDGEDKLIERIVLQLEQGTI